MELIATARFKQAMDRASAATAYTDHITRLVANLATTGLDLSHPLLESHANRCNGSAVGTHVEPGTLRRIQRQRAATGNEKL